MKFKSKLFLLVMALVLVVALVACNNGKTPDVTEDPAVTTTEAPATTTEAPATTTEAPATTTEAPATTTATPVVTTTAAPVTTTKAPVVTTKAPTTSKVVFSPVTTKEPISIDPGSSLNPIVTTKAPTVDPEEPAVTTTTTAAPVEPAEPVDYNSLYVGYNGTEAEAYVFDGASLIVDFYAAKATDGYLAPTSETTWADTTKPSATRFAAAASNYTPYIVYSAVTNGLSGGTAEITSPWFFQNYYKEGYWAWEADGGLTSAGGDVNDMRTEANGYTSGDGTATVSEKTVHYENTVVEGVTDYYMQNGTWAKPTYVSKWQDGSLHLGSNSALQLGTAINNAIGEDGEYTVQLIVKRAVTWGSWTAYLGTRVTISESNGIKFANNGTTYQGAFSTIIAGDLDAVNTLTFAFDRNATADNFTAYVNNEASTMTIEYKTLDTNLKIFENADSYVYAIRVYDYVLSADEIAQNHTADLAKYFQLDVAKYSKLDATSKKAVWDEMKAYTLNDEKTTVEAAFAAICAEGTEEEIPVVTTPTATATTAPDSPAPAPTKIVYKENISFELEKNGDAYVADEIFYNTVSFESSTATVWNNTGDSSATADNSAKVALAWDGSYIYAFVEVTDPTLTTKGEAWVANQYTTKAHDLFYNDSFEIYYCFDGAASAGGPDGSNAKIDAYGYQLFTGDGEGSVWFDEVEATAAASETEGKYYIIYKIPAKTEANVALEGGETLYFSEQINDIRDVTDTSTKAVYCSGARSNYANWVSFELEEKPAN